MRDAAVGQELIERLQRYTMVAARCLHRADAPGQYPVFDCRIADAEFLGGLSRSEQSRGSQ